MPNLTLNQIPKATDGTHVQDSLISDNGTTVTVAAPLAVTGAITPSTPVAVANGGTGSTTPSAALTALGAVAKAGDTMTGALGIGIAATGGRMLEVNGQFGALGHTTRSGVSGAYGGNVFNINWTGTVPQLWIDSVNQGVITLGGPYLLISGGTLTDALAGTTLALASPGGAATLNVKGGAAAGDTLSTFSTGPAGADSTSVLQLFLDSTNSNVNGSITRTGTNNVAFNTASDERLKADIVESERGLDALMAIRVSDYSMGETRSQGLLAQDIAAVYPEAVHVGGDDPNLQPWMLDYGRLTPLLIKAVQELSAKVAALEGKPA